MEINENGKKNSESVGYNKSSFKRDIIAMQVYLRKQEKSKAT